MRTRRQIAIVGAGIIGLLTARLLLARGHRVLLVDRGPPGRAASWAGGGIVSPLYPWRYTDAVTALAANATEAHRELAAGLRAETGIDPQFNPCGLLMLDPREHETALAWCRQHRRRVIVYDRDGLQRIQAALGAVERGFWFPDIGNVRNPRLLKALIASVAAHPQADCRWQADVTLDDAGGGTLRVNGSTMLVDDIMVTAGAWSASLLRPFGVELPVRPVRGQMLLYPPQPGLLRCIVLRNGRYLIPRRDGRILAGSTLEYTDFACETTPEARVQLQAGAIHMLPALAGIEPEKQWAGLRPGSPSGIPFIDRIPESRVWVNAGHFRNGLVLAPAAAALGVALLLGDRPDIDPAPYRLAASRPATYL
ncbi:MAG: NAD(P)/FAD-dependent oxidoreductase [Pseudomonadota bacterium]